MRVLVADDDVDVRDVIADLLSGPDLEIRLAADADEARGELERGGVEVFVCDLELLRSQRGRLGRVARTLTPRPRLVAISASGFGAGSRESDATLAKPFSRSQLLAAIRAGDGATSPSRARCG